MFFGRVPDLAVARQRALDDAYRAHPGRFVHGPPQVRLPPPRVAINPIDPGAPVQTVQNVLDGQQLKAPAREDDSPPPQPVLPGAPKANVYVNCS